MRRFLTLSLVLLLAGGVFNANKAGDFDDNLKMILTQSQIPADQYIKGYV